MCRLVWGKMPGGRQFSDSLHVYIGVRMKRIEQLGRFSVWYNLSFCVLFVQVVGGEPVVLVGNSLGGYNCLKAGVEIPGLVRGVVLLNSAGRFEEIKEEAEAQLEAALPDNKAGESAKELLREVPSFSHLFVNPICCFKRYSTFTVDLLWVDCGLCG